MASSAPAKASTSSGSPSRTARRSPAAAADGPRLGVAEPEAVPQRASLLVGEAEHLRRRVPLHVRGAHRDRPRTPSGRSTARRRTRRCAWTNDAALTVRPGTVIDSRITAPAPGRSTVPGARPLARPRAIRSGPPCETTTTSWPVVTRSRHAAATLARQVGRTFAVRPVDRGLAVGEGGGRGRGARRSSSSNVSPSAIPKSASRQRSSVAMSSMPATSAMAAAVANMPGAADSRRCACRAPGSWRDRRPIDGRRPRPRRREAGRCGRNSGSLSRPSAHGGRGRCPPYQASLRIFAAGRTRDRRGLERRHLVADAYRGFDQVHRQRRTGPLPQPQIEVQQWPAPERLEDHRVTRLDRPMRRDKPRGNCRLQFRGTSAAAPAMNPSRMTGIRASAPPTITPTSTAISRPPTAGARRSGRAGRGC